MSTSSNTGSVVLSIFRYPGSPLKLRPKSQLLLPECCVPRSLKSSTIEQKFETLWERRTRTIKDEFPLHKAKAQGVGQRQAIIDSKDKFTHATSATITMLRCYATPIISLLALDIFRIILELSKPILLGWLLNHIRQRDRPWGDQNLPSPPTSYQ